MTGTAVTSSHEQARVPGLDCWGAEGAGMYVAASKPPNDTEVPGPVFMGPQTPDPVWHSTATAPNWVNRLDLKSCEKSPFYLSLDGGFPVSVSFLVAPSPNYGSTPGKAPFGVKIYLADQGQGQEIVRHKSMVVSLSNLHSGLQPRNPISFTKALIAPGTLAGSEEMLPSCGHFW